MLQYSDFFPVPLQKLQVFGLPLQEEQVLRPEPLQAKHLEYEFVVRL